MGEQNVPLAVRVNIEGLHNVIELSKQCEFEQQLKNGQQFPHKLISRQTETFCAEHNRSFWPGVAAQSNTKPLHSEAKDYLWSLKGD